MEQYIHYHFLIEILFGISELDVDFRERSLSRVKIDDDLVNPAPFIPA
ncbi:hypothetical protein QUB13_09060 [Microcoleus sp. B4-D4]